MGYLRYLLATLNENECRGLKKWVDERIMDNAEQRTIALSVGTLNISHGNATSRLQSSIDARPRQGNG